MGCCISQYTRTEGLRKAGYYLMSGPLYERFTAANQSAFCTLTIYSSGLDTSPHLVSFLQQLGLLICRNNTQMHKAILLHMLHFAPLGPKILYMYSRESTVMHAQQGPQHAGGLWNSGQMQDLSQAMQCTAVSLLPPHQAVGPKQSTPGRDQSPARRGRKRSVRRHVCPYGKKAVAGPSTAGS